MGLYLVYKYPSFNKKNVNIKDRVRNIKNVQHSRVYLLAWHGMA